MLEIIEKGPPVINSLRLLCCGLLLAGCATPPPAPDVTSHYDEVSGLRTDLLSDNMLTTEGPPRELIC
jgi:hypothetical protein